MLPGDDGHPKTGPRFWMVCGLATHRRVMSLTNEAEANLVLLLFNNTNWANIGDATGLRGSTTAGVFYTSLHTADPGETGDQTTSEANYTGYSRVSVNRASGAGGFTCATDTASNTSAVPFGACTAGSSTCTHFGIGTGSSGAGHLVASGALTASLAVTAGITPSAAAGALTIVAA